MTHFNSSRNRHIGGPSWHGQYRGSADQYHRRTSSPCPAGQGITHFPGGIIRNKSNGVKRFTVGPAVTRTISPTRFFSVRLISPLRRYQTIREAFPLLQIYRPIHQNPPPSYVSLEVSFWMFSLTMTFSYIFVFIEGQMSTGALVAMTP